MDSHAHGPIPLIHGLVVGGLSGLWAIADVPSAHLTPIICAAIGSLVPVSANLLKWSRERRDTRIAWLEDNLGKRTAEVDRLRMLLEAKEATCKP